MKILLAKRRAMGDTILLSSTVELIHSSFPQAEISVLVPKLWLPVLLGNPAIHNLWSFEEGWLSLLPKLWSHKFDYFFQLHASPGTLPLAWLSRAGQKHFHYQNAETEKAYGKHPGALEWDAFFLRKFFSDKISLPAPMPKIFLTESEKQMGRDFWRARGVVPEKIVFLGLGASRTTKRWWPAHFARLAELCRDRLGLTPALVPGPSEEDALFCGRVIDEMRVRGFSSSAHKDGFVHVSGLGVRELAQAVSAVKIYVGNDSGPKHMAAALGIPTLTLFGPEDPGEWHPYGLDEHPIFFQPGLPCRKEDNGRWCGIPECGRESVEGHRCMGDLDPVDVFATLERRLK